MRLPGQAESLAAELQKAMDDYAAYLKGETVPVTLAVAQGQSKTVR